MPPVTDREQAQTAAYVEALFLQHRASLLRYLAGLLPNREDAAELLQETYLRLLKQEGLEHIEANARAYAFQIATNLVRDFFRQRKAHRADQHEALEDNALEPELQEPEHSILLDETLARFKRALLALPPPVRDVFLLHRFRDMTYPEIARHQGLSLRTVERHMSEAMTSLRDAMEWNL